MQITTSKNLSNTIRLSAITLIALSMSACNYDSVSSCIAESQTKITVSGKITVAGKQTSDSNSVFACLIQADKITVSGYSGGKISASEKTNPIQKNSINFNHR